MVNEIKYTSIRRVLDNLIEHPMLADLSLEKAVRYTLRFISINGFPELYQDKMAIVDIEDYRGALPCDLISIKQVKDTRNGFCLRSMADNFPNGMLDEEYREKSYRDFQQPSFKTQGRIIYTSFKCGKIEIAYKAIPTDEDGFPLLIDNEVYLQALEAYIKERMFTVKFDQGKISAGILQNAQKDYAWAAAQLNSEMQIPSVSEMESIASAWNSMLPNTHKFQEGFRGLGDREYIRRHK